MKSWTNDEQEMIINFGSLGYDADRCAGILERPKVEIEKAMKDTDGDFMTLYLRGQYRAEYVIDIKLFELAQTGDVKAIEKLDQRRRVRTKR